MFRYYYTQDMRIGDIEKLLKPCAEAYASGSIPSGTQDKGVNNSYNTIGFYFNVKNGDMNQLAVQGDIKEVMLNFAKKFQFPNTRDKSHFKTYMEDSIELAPLREVIKLLFTATLIDGTHAYISPDEIIDFIFYNEKVAKTNTFNYSNLYDDIKYSRKNKKFRNSKDIASQSDREWVGQERQVREMLSILIKLQILGFKKGQYKLELFDKNLQLNKKILEIVEYNEYWDYGSVFNGQNIDNNSIDRYWDDLVISYEQYMNSNITSTRTPVSPITQTSSNNINISQSSNYNNDLIGENILYYGIPGVGKSYTIEQDYPTDGDLAERIVFHPDYTNSDFIGQLLPQRVEGKLEYLFNPGPFTKILKRAMINNDEMHYLIIEEINRGNAPAIFGEIFQLLDRDEVTGFSEYSISNDDISVHLYGEEDQPIKIPNNLTILATMNTADQNVFTLDTAFQRRWQMNMVKNDLENANHYDTEILNTGVTWGKFAEEVNQIILENSLGLSSVEDKRLGAYFVKESDLLYEQDNEEQNRKFASKVLKYLWDDAFKYNKDDIFKSEYKSLEQVIEDFDGYTRMEVFKDGFLEGN